MQTIKLVSSLATLAALLVATPAFADVPGGAPAEGGGGAAQGGAAQGGASEGGGGNGTAGSAEGGSGTGGNGEGGGGGDSEDDGGCSINNAGAPVAATMSMLALVGLVAGARRTKKPARRR
jgi:hypothetical protein